MYLPSIFDVAKLFSVSEADIKYTICFEKSNPNTFTTPDQTAANKSVVSIPFFNLVQNIPHFFNSAQTAD